SRDAYFRTHAWPDSSIELAELEDSIELPDGINVEEPAVGETSHRLEFATKGHAWQAVHSNFCRLADDQVGPIGLVHLGLNFHFFDCMYFRHRPTRLNLVAFAIVRNGHAAEKESSQDIEILFDCH